MEIARPTVNNNPDLFLAQQKARKKREDAAAAVKRHSKDSGVAAAPGNPGAVKPKLPPHKPFVNSKTVKHPYKLPGSNDTCLCTSGLKFKHCCRRKFNGDNARDAKAAREHAHRRAVKESRAAKTLAEKRKGNHGSL